MKKMVITKSGICALLMAVGVSMLVSSSPAIADSVRCDVTVHGTGKANAGETWIDIHGSVATALFEQMTKSFHEQTSRVGPGGSFRERVITVRYGKNYTCTRNEYTDGGTPKKSDTCVLRTVIDSQQGAFRPLDLDRLR